VADVQDVEAAVGERDRATGGTLRAYARHECVAGENLTHA
jgi:hypothetical protein